jgi:staphylococcal nuclease domain-containing protein 1
VHRNIAEQLVEKGLASVVRHRRDDEDRSVDLDKLIAAEQRYPHFRHRIVHSRSFDTCSAVAEARGIYSNKEQPAPKQPLNLSEVFILYYHNCYTRTTVTFRHMLEPHNS